MTLIKMKTPFSFCIFLIVILIFTESCNSSRLYRLDDKNRISHGQLSESTFNALKQFLTTTTNATLKDTIIIKYDYNNETCWDILDQKDDNYIMGFVTRHQDRVQQVLKTRQNISVFNFREPGNNLNKIIKWDKSIMIDSSKQLFNLLFKDRCTCGSSILVTPDKQYISIRSDSHFEALDMTEKQIVTIISKK